MPSEKQRAAAKTNIKKAQAAWQAMSHTEHARAQPQGRGRQKPGTGGGGEFYRIVVRPKEQRQDDRGDRAAEPRDDPDDRQDLRRVGLRLLRVSGRPVTVADGRGPVFWAD